MTFYSNQLELLNQNLTEINKNIHVSFEFFPPKTKESEKIFWKGVDKLSFFKPDFFSVTHSVTAGNIDVTSSIVKKIKHRTNIIGTPHLTCINISTDQLLRIAQYYWNNNIRNIIALRGDSFLHAKNKNMYGKDLVILLKKVGDFNISVAAYPEIHPEAKNAQSDLINLKSKIDAGANRAITQFFFDVDKYLHFRDRCVSVGIDIEIIPGILPIFNFNQLKRFALMTNVNIPNWMHKIFTNLDDDAEARKLLGANIAIDMIKILIREGVRYFHFYTLNFVELSYLICRAIGIK